MSTPFDPETLDRILVRGRTSLKVRLTRWRSKRWQVVQCAVAAGVAWFLAKHLLHHPAPVFAPIAAVASLGTSYGQRLRRVTEVTIGVSLGVLVGDLLVAVLGQGAWQLILIVALAFSVAILLDTGTIFQNQAAVQSIFVTAVLPGNSGIWTRWTEALLGGVVALVAATAVPAAPLMRPRQQAALVVGRISQLLRSAAQVMEDGRSEHGYAVLADARATDKLISELRAAADEGMAVVASSPFRVRHKAHVRRMAEMVDPLDRALRSTRVLVRQVAVTAHRGRYVPPSYVALALDLADAVDEVAAELAVGCNPESAREPLMAVGAASGAVERSESINAEMILVQLRSVVVDMLVLTGLGQIEAADALPSPRG